VTTCPTHDHITAQNVIRTDIQDELKYFVNKIQLLALSDKIMAIFNK